MRVMKVKVEALSLVNKYKTGKKRYEGTFSDEEYFVEVIDGLPDDATIVGVELIPSEVNKVVFTIESNEFDEILDGEEIPVKKVLETIKGRTKDDK